MNDVFLRATALAVVLVAALAAQAWGEALAEKVRVVTREAGRGPWGANLDRN